MNTRELAYRIVDQFSEEEIKGFVVLFKRFNTFNGDDLSNSSDSYAKNKKILVLIVTTSLL